MGQPCFFPFFIRDILLTHARMGQPRIEADTFSISDSYPCTHGATFSRVAFIQSLIFLPMHAWGNPRFRTRFSSSLLLTHARMGQPIARCNRSSTILSYPCTHGATSYYNHLINNDNLTLLTFADF